MTVQIIELVGKGTFRLQGDWAHRYGFVSWNPGKLSATAEFSSEKHARQFAEAHGLTIVGSCKLYE